MKRMGLDATVRERVLHMLQSSFGKEQVVDTEDGICVVLSGYIVLVRVDEARLEVAS